MRLTHWCLMGQVTGRLVHLIWMLDLLEILDFILEWVIVYISKFIYISKASRILINFTYNAVKQVNLARCMLIMLYVGKQKLLTII
jgi:hypothetical protein